MSQTSNARQAQCLGSSLADTDKYLLGNHRFPEGLVPDEGSEFFLDVQ
jgi:hypothetical protein